MTLMERAKLWGDRRQRARRFGIPFYRSKTLRMPPKFKVNGDEYRLEMLSENTLEYECLNILVDDTYGLSLLKDIRIVLDVGANHGFFALAVRGFFPQAVVHGYEPNPRVWHCFEHNYRLLECIAFREAMGQLDGWVEIEHLGDSISAQTRTTEKSGRIPMVSLGRAIERIGGKVDLLKLDCEGAEWDILQDRNALGHVSAITMEYHDFGFDGCNDYRKHAEKLLVSSGFDIVRHVAVNQYGHILAVRPC